MALAVFTTLVRLQKRVGILTTGERRLSTGWVFPQASSARLMQNRQQIATDVRKKKSKSLHICESQVRCWLPPRQGKLEPFWHAACRNCPMQPRLHIKDICRIYGFSRSTLYRRLRDGRFPRPIRSLGLIWQPEDLALAESAGQVPPRQSP